MAPKPIGIIGGAGPLAGIALLTQIFRLARERYGCWKDEDFPMVFVLSFPFRDMLSDEIDPPRIREELRSCLKKLRDNGAAVIGIACNTLHAFLDSQEEDRPDLIQLPLIAAEEVSSPPLILGTSTSRRFELYSKRFPCLYPDAKTQLEIDTLITQILKGEEVTERLQALVQAAPAESILLGCTELSLYTPSLLSCNKKIIDPLQIMANKLINYSFGDRS